MVSAKEWSMNYDSVKRAIINKRRMGESFTTSEEKALSSSLKLLDQQLVSMTSAPNQYEIVASELARRRVLIDNLKAQMSSAASLPRRDNMMGSVEMEVASKNNNNINSNRGGNSPLHSSSSSAFNPINSSDRGLVQRQTEIIKLQDEMLEDIDEGVSRLHRQALQMGEEARIHVRLLDDLDSDVVIATHALEAETRHAATLRERSSMCKMYICIAIEVLLIVILSIVAFIR